MPVKGGTAQSTTFTADDSASKTKNPSGRPKAQGEALRNDSQQGSLFTFRNAVRDSWHHKVLDEDNSIRIVLDQPGSQSTALVSDQIPPELLFSLAPALRKDLFDRRVILQASTALNDEAINDVVNAILDSARKNAPLTMSMSREPVRMIKIHCVLMRFGLQKEADTLLEALWSTMGSKELSLADVSWIWDTFADPTGQKWGRNDYVAPAAQDYVQMMAWQLLNMDAEGKLNDDIKKDIEIEKEPRYFFDMLKTRREEYGLGRERLTKINAGAQVEVKPKQSSGSTRVDALERSKKAVGSRKGIKVEQKPVLPTPEATSFEEPQEEDSDSLFIPDTSGFTNSLSNPLSSPFGYSFHRPKLPAINPPTAPSTGFTSGNTTAMQTQGATASARQQPQGFWTGTSPEYAPELQRSTDASTCTWQSTTPKDTPTPSSPAPNARPSLSQFSAPLPSNNTIRPTPTSPAQPNPPNFSFQQQPPSQSPALFNFASAMGRQFGSANSNAGAPNSAPGGASSFAFGGASNTPDVNSMFAPPLTGIIERTGRKMAQAKGTKGTFRRR